MHRSPRCVGEWKTSYSYYWWSQLCWGCSGTRQQPPGYVHSVKGRVWVKQAGGQMQWGGICTESCREMVVHLPEHSLIAFS